MTLCMFRIYLIVYLLFHTNWGRASIKKIRRQCEFLSYFLIRRSRSTHFHLKFFFMFSLKKTFYKRSFSAFGRKVYMYVLIKFQIRMCYYHGAHPHQHCNVQTKRHRTPSSKIVTSKHNVTETFFHVFFFKISQFFYHIKEPMEISEF